MTRPTKRIGGVPHRQVRCAWCRELIWMPVKQGNKDGKIICGTCWSDRDPVGDAGGGKRVIRKADPQS